MNADANIQILVCHHKPSAIVENGCLVPIHAGRELAEEPLMGMIGDNTGDHISARNKSFCELTALYWAWRNLEADYYGLMHYRRFFDFTDANPNPVCYDLGEKTAARLGISEESIQGALEGFDVVLPKAVDVPTLERGPTVYDQYAAEHLAEDIEVLRNAVASTAPDTLQDFDAVFEGSQAYFFCMFVMRREVFHNYSQWLFSVLFEAERHIDWPHRTGYQHRVLAFMGERLLTVYAHHLRRTGSWRIKELPVVFVADKRPSVTSRLKEARRKWVRLQVREGGVYFKLLGKEFNFPAEPAKKKPAA